MDRLTIIMVRSALVWLVIGIAVGGLMLVDRAIPGNWRGWFAPSHGHVLFVGWFLQFAIGIAYWLLPRKRTETRPVGYAEGLGVLAVVMLNVGLACRVIAEPFERVGNMSTLTLSLLFASALLQVAAVGIFVSQMWPRIYGRNRLGKPSGKASGRNTSQ